MKMQWYRVLQFILIFSLYSPVSFAAPKNMDARVWLDRMSHASREQSYLGVFTYEHGSDMVSLSIAHTVKDGIERERLFHLSGKPREVIRDGHEITCIHPGNQLIRLDNSIPAGPFAKTFSANLGKLDKYYQLVMAGEDRVAGREVVKLNIISKDAYRFGYQLFLDKEFALLLKSQMVNAVGDVLERFQFATIEIGNSVPEDALKATTDGRVMAHHNELAGPGSHVATGVENGHEHGWYLSWLPNGFMVAAGDILRGPLHDKAMSSLMYTDGLAVFSVFVEKADAKAVDGRIQRGGTIVYAKKQFLREQDYMVTVVGEVPELTAEKVVSAISMH